jgi:hypothetical protein
MALAKKITARKTTTPTRQRTTVKPPATSCIGTPPYNIFYSG